MLPGRTHMLEVYSIMQVRSVPRLSADQLVPTLPRMVFIFTTGIFVPTHCAILDSCRSDRSMGAGSIVVG
jgi:hypothetical protein